MNYFPFLLIASFFIAACFIGYAIWEYRHFMYSSKYSADEIIEAISDILILINPEGKILRTNKVAQSAIGYREEQLHGLSLERIIPADAESIIGCQRLKDREGELITFNGKKILISLSASILYDKNKNSLGYVITCRNRQERININEKLNQYKENLEDIVVEQTTNLIRINKSLQKEIEKKEKYEEQLREKNKELFTANEKLRAAMEELEASNEVYEAQNEELIQSAYELQKNEAFQKSIFRVAPTGIGVIVDGKFTTINKQISYMTNYTADELIGKNSRTIYPTGEEYDFLNKEMTTQIKKFGTGTLETRWQRKDGEIIDVLLNATPITADNPSTGITFTALDITDRKVTEKRLRESEEHLRKLLENSPVGIGISDGEGYFTFLNHKFTELFGYTIDDIPDLNTWWLLAYPDINYRNVVKEIWDAAFEESHKTGKSIDPQEWEVTCKNGNVKYIQFYMTPIGGLSFTVINDLTEKKQSEQLLIQTEKMMTVGGLAAGMAHEINNPLGVILQGIQITLNRLSPDNSDNRETAEKRGTNLEKIMEYLEERNIIKYLNGIRDAGMRASTIIKNMLHFSRKSETYKKPADLHAVIEKAIEIASKDYDLEKKYDFRNITINRNYDKNLKMVPCIENEIEQVILNLLKNSSQAMAEIHGRDYKPVIDIVSFCEENHAVIEISDNGPGMIREVLNRVFEPFYTTKEVGTGTGLGLSVSYFIITNNHGGIFTAESEPGAGSCFIIKLPL